MGKKRVGGTRIRIALGVKYKEDKIIRGSRYKEGSRPFRLKC